MNIPWAKVVETLLAEVELASVAVVGLDGSVLTAGVISGAVVVVDTSRKGTMKGDVTKRGLGKLLAEWKTRREMQRENGIVWIAYDEAAQQWRIGLGAVVDTAAAIRMMLKGFEVVGMEVAVG